MIVNCGMWNLVCVYVSVLRDWEEIEGTIGRAIHRR